MNTQTITLFLAILGSFAIYTPLWAQKPIIKYIQHEKHIPNDDGDLTLSLRIEQNYNRYGNVTRQEYYYPTANGKLHSDRKKVYSYDGKGRHLNTLEYNGDNILESEIKIYWDEFDNKNKVDHITYLNGKQINVAVTYQLEYDDAGNKKSENFFSDNGNPIKRRTWYYNSQDEIKKSETWIDKKNQPRKEVLIKYHRDANGNLMKSISREKVNGKIYRKDIRFFSQGYMIEWRKYIEGKFESAFINEYRDSVIIRTTRKNTRKIINPNKLKSSKPAKSKRIETEEIWLTNSEYDAYGNIVITTQSINDKVLYVTQYKYDDYGNKTHTIKTDKEKNIKEEEYLEYEDYGNISLRRLSKNDKILSEERYTYEYHEKD